MRILFIENKHVTKTWEALAPRLIAAGDEIHWMVQNPLWAPDIGRVHRLPFPRPQDLAPAGGARFAKLRDRDRGINYFGGNDRHYAHYEREIAALIAAVRPDVIIGEATLFHELLAIDLARDAGIPYVFPTSIRYPTDRIGFLAGDKQVAVCGSGDQLHNEELDHLLETYARRQTVPLFYTSLGGSGWLFRMEQAWKALGKNAKASLSRAIGERFNTPSIIHKLGLERRQKALMAQWQAAAAAKNDMSGATRVLFPLQMLPESTLETWGYDHRDQQKVLEALVKAADESTIFLVKPNPWPRYEITPSLVEFVHTHPRVRPLPLEMKMDQVFWSADLIVTVTGTVAVEAFLTGKPFVTVEPSLVTPFAPERTVIAPSEIAAVIKQLRAGDWKVAGVQARRAFLEHQIRAGHRATMADTYHFPPVLLPDNIDCLAKAYSCLRRSIAAGSLTIEIAAAEQEAARPQSS